METTTVVTLYVLRDSENKTVSNFTSEGRAIDWVQRQYLISGNSMGAHTIVKRTTTVVEEVVKHV